MLMLIFIIIASWLLVGLPVGWLVGGMCALRDYRERPRYRRTPN